MPYCTNCGAELGQGDAFCSECGTEVGDSTGAGRREAEQVEREPAQGATPPDASQDDVANRDETEETTGSTNWDFDKDSDDVKHGPEKDGLDFGHLFVASTIAVVPAFVAYMLVTVAANTTLGWTFLIALPVFSYLLYQRHSAKAMAGGAAFWLAIEAFLSPLALGVYSVVYASSETTTAAEQTGAAIGGFMLTAGAFVIGVPVGIVLYLLSKRLDVDADTDGRGSEA